MWVKFLDSHVFFRDVHLICGIAHLHYLHSTRRHAQILWCSQHCTQNKQEKQFMNKKCAGCFQMRDCMFDYHVDWLPVRIRMSHVQDCPISLLTVHLLFSSRYTTNQCSCAEFWCLSHCTSESHYVRIGFVSFHSHLTINMQLLT